MLALLQCYNASTRLDAGLARLYTCTLASMLAHPMCAISLKTYFMSAAGGAAALFDLLVDALYLRSIAVEARAGFISGDNVRSIHVLASRTLLFAAVGFG